MNWLAEYKHSILLTRGGAEYRVNVFPAKPTQTHVIISLWLLNSPCFPNYSCFLTELLLYWLVRHTLLMFLEESTGEALLCGSSVWRNLLNLHFTPVIWKEWGRTQVFKMNSFWDKTCKIYMSLTIHIKRKLFTGSFYKIISGRIRKDGGGEHVLLCISFARINIWHGRTF